MNIIDTAKSKTDFDLKPQYNPDIFSQNFVHLSFSSDSKIIGRKFPQVDKIDLKSAHSIGFEFIENLKFNKITLFSSSKLTDNLSCTALSAFSLLLSKKALDVFKSCNLGNFRIYPASVEFKGKTYEYGVLHFLNNLSGQLDFVHSAFYIANSADEYGSDIEITDFEDFKTKRKELNIARRKENIPFSRIRLKKGYLRNADYPDIFDMDFLPDNPIISLKLARAIVDNKLNGFVFHKVYNLME